MNPHELTESRLMQGQKKIYTVSELNREMRMLVESKYPTVWVEGEISNFKRHHSGHMYLSLKDDKAQISAVFFGRFNQAIRFDIKDGLQVIALGRLSIYESRGQYQLYIERLEPKGLGALQLAFLQLREKLEKEGLFDPACKKPLPKYPNVVGVITSPTGAAIRDIMNVISRRFHGTEMLIYPVRVQGEGAAAEIAQAVREMNEMGGVDVLIVGRGGGSLEDLWAFNEEVLVRAVFESKIPVISAVGHEIDWTICDWVADLRAPTPSAAAELVVQSREELEKRLEHFQVRMRNAVSNFLETKKQELRAFAGSYAFRQPLLLIDQYSQRLDEMARQLQNYLKALVSQKANSFHTLAGRLHALSPLAILERGYSITFHSDGRLLKEASEAKVGGRIVTRLMRGTIHSTINEILSPAEGAKSANREEGVKKNHDQ